MGEVVDINQKRTERRSRQNTEFWLGLMGLAATAFVAYTIGHNRGEGHERDRQILQIPKACFSFDRMQNGPLSIRLDGTENEVRFSVSGSSQVTESEDLGNALAKPEPFKLIC